MFNAYAICTHISEHECMQDFLMLAYTIFMQYDMKISFVLASNSLKKAALNNNIGERMKFETIAYFDAVFLPYVLVFYHEYKVESVCTL